MRGVQGNIEINDIRGDSRAVSLGEVTRPNSHASESQPDTASGSNHLPCRPEETKNKTSSEIDERTESLGGEAQSTIQPR